MLETISSAKGKRGILQKESLMLSPTRSSRGGE